MGNALVHRRRMACVAVGLSLILSGIVILFGYSPTPGDEELLRFQGGGDGLCR